MVSCAGDAWSDRAVVGEALAVEGERRGEGGGSK